MKFRLLICIPLVCCFLTPSVKGQGHTERGAVLGGLAGALTGAAIGKQNGQTTEGTLIGGAVGLITGGVIGNSIDENERYSRAAAQQRYYHHQQQVARAVSVYDVVNMTHNGLSDEVIINHIRQNGVQRRIEVNDVISLHQQGVSQRVIAELQRAPRPGVRPVYRRPVVVEEHHYVAPPYPVYHRPYHVPHYGHSHHRRYYRRPSSFSWGVTFSN